MPCKEHSLQSKTVLRQKGLKATPARLAVLDVFEHAKKPLSIREVAKALKADNPDLATLYRNVESLVSLGLLKEIFFTSNMAHYESAKLAHHHHIVCKVCGRIESIQMCLAAKPQRQIIQAAHFGKIESHSLEFFGICKKCEN